MIDRVMEQLNLGKQKFDFVRIENQWEVENDTILKIVVKNEKFWFVEVILTEDNDLEVGDLEEYSLENDMWN